MDRRQQKTRMAIFSAFITLLNKKQFNQITVEEIINLANVGRATFYSHFETKDLLLKEFCQELFSHIFESDIGNENLHSHLFDCDSKSPTFLHLFSHLQKNDNHILELLSCENNSLFLGYFKQSLTNLIENQLYLFNKEKYYNLPKDFFINHVASTFVETVSYWINNGLKQSADEITEYFFIVLN